VQDQNNLDKQTLTPKATAPLRTVRRQGNWEKSNWLQDRLAMRTHPHERENKKEAQQQNQKKKMGITTTASKNNLSIEINEVYNRSTEVTVLPTSFN
jgi:hypothetical protein